MLLAGPAGAAVIAGGNVSTEWAVREDLYVAGGEVAVRGEVGGDLVAAGGRVLVEQPVHGDVAAAGGEVDIRGAVADDVRAVGGAVTIEGRVAGDVMAAGGRVTLPAGAEIQGRAGLAGSAVELAGHVRRSVRAAGKRIRISGQVDGNVDLAAASVEVLPTARIGGTLTYRSGSAARIEPGAQIAGGVVHRPLAAGERAGRALRVLLWVLAVALLLAFVLVGIVLLVLFPEATRIAARRIATDPGRSLALGLLMLLGAPLVILLLVVTVVGIPLGIGIAALWVVWLLVGFLIGALFLGDLGVRALGRAPSRGWRLVGLLLALALLGLLQAVPFLGSLTLLAALAFGVGAWSLHVARGYRRTGSPPA
ncbi:MAG: polymer-forming cytoskeletal protein [Candidatus Methylomirabilales bacterium]